MASVGSVARRAAPWIMAAILLLAGYRVIGDVIRGMVYPAPPVAVPSPPPAPLEEVPLKDGDRTLSAWWSPAEGAPRVCVLLFHGNGENLETMRQSGTFEGFRALGAAVLALDYPGYGRSEGSPREETVLSAGRRGLAALDARATDGCPRVVVGWSLGAAAAIRTAVDPPGAPPDGLVLLSPWNRLEDVARAHFPVFLVKSLLPERYDSVEAAGRWRGPSLVVHGAADQIIPARLGRELYEALPEPKRWLEVPGAGHNDLLARPEPWEAMGEMFGGL